MENTIMDKNKIPTFELLFLIIGELAVSTVTAAVFLILKQFDASVIFGALLGSAITVTNFLVLIITTNRAIDKMLLERGDEEMDDEAAAEFAKKYRAQVQAASKISYIIRLLSIAIALVLALILRDVFNVIATVIPLLMLRPMLSISHLIKTKRNKD